MGFLGRAIRLLPAVGLLLVVGSAVPCACEEAPPVKVLPCPNGGKSPNAVADAQGSLHIIYFKEGAKRVDLFYVVSRDSGSTFTSPIQINPKPIGNFRGMDVALDGKGRAHVMWGEGQEGEDGGGFQYTRLDLEKNAFEAPRQLMSWSKLVDGPGTLSCGPSGAVYAVWQAQVKGDLSGFSEGDRGVVVASSKDGGKTFSREVDLWKETRPPSERHAEGACACCSMDSTVAPDGKLLILFRAAKDAKQRDSYLLASANPKEGCRSVKLDEWSSGCCVASQFSIAPAANATYAAWETRGQVFYSAVDVSSGPLKLKKAVSAPLPASNRYYPQVAAGANGSVLLAWTEGQKWGGGKSIAWQAYDPDGKRISKAGRADKVMKGFTISAVRTREGGFLIFHD